jgi:hypothetical protein
MRTCKSCSTPKPLDSDNFRGFKRKGKQYFTQKCRECIRHEGRAYQKEYREANPEACKERCKAWHETHREYSRAVSRQYHENHKDDPTYQEANRKRARDYYNALSPGQKHERALNSLARHQARLVSDPAYAKAIKDKSNKRNAQLRAATPQWADSAAIQRFYDEAQYMQDETGEAYEVDHIDPLQGDLVCGLHVPENLRVVPAAVNRNKGAKFTPYFFEF